MNRTVRCLAMTGLLGVICVFPLSARTQGATDSDADGVPDALDNCTLVPNRDQRDEDEDGYGTLCDRDFNNDGVSALQDVYVIYTEINGTNTEYDVDGDGFVDLADISIVFNGQYTLPGPSGLACAAANEKGTCPPAGS